MTTTTTLDPLTQAGLAYLAAHAALVEAYYAAGFDMPYAEDTFGEVRSNCEADAPAETASIMAQLHATYHTYAGTPRRDRGYTWTREIA